VIFDSIIKIMSLGASIGVAERSDVGNLTTRLHQAELVAQGYLKLPREALFLRPGFRLGYEYTPYPDDPQSVRIDENTWNGTLELALLYEGFLIPSLTLQSSLLARRLKLATRGNINMEASGLPPIEWMGANAVAFGLGLPIADGRLIVEPFYRIVWIRGDDRRNGQWGLEATWAVSWAEESPENLPK
jgi:hypothetical protein